MKLSADTEVMMAGGILAIAAFWWFWKSPGTTGASIGAGVVSAVTGAADGVIGEAGNIAGDVLGLPRTSANVCQLAKDAGDTWGASLNCPASNFISWWWNKPAKQHGASGGW